LSPIFLNFFAKHSVHEIVDKESNNNEQQKETNSPYGEYFWSEESGVVNIEEIFYHGRVVIK
jgi:hypothetical protein